MSVTVRSSVHILPGATVDSRRERMVRLILDHLELDEPRLAGKLVFDIGRGQQGQPEVAWQFIPRPERLI